MDNSAWLALAFRVLVSLVVLVALLTSVFLALVRHFARADVRLSKEQLASLAPKKRPEGVAFVKALGKEQRIDGAILLTGATGFVGCGVLFALLAQAESLGLTRVVLVVRRKGSSVDARLADLQANPALEEVREAFDRLVSVLEGDVLQPDLGLGDLAWPYDEPLRAVLHCAADVRFDMSLPTAALSSITASLEAAQVAVRWGASRFVFVSTAFVHGVPSVGCLEEKLVALGNFDPMELYCDAMADGCLAKKAMRELGFPNTYTFTKAIAEHLVFKNCARDGIDPRIVRPSVVGPAWAAPYPGWIGDKPSTIVSAFLLIAVRGVRVFKTSSYPCPAVPVDMVAGVVVDALSGPRDASCQIVQAAVDASEAHHIHSIAEGNRYTQLMLALRGTLSIPEVGLMFWLSEWAKNPSLFWALHCVFNVAPCALALLLCSPIAHVARIMPCCNSKVWERRCKVLSALKKHSMLPALIAPFSGPAVAWRFRSPVRLPANFNAMEYTALVFRAAAAFADHGIKVSPRREVLSKAMDVPVGSAGTALQDACDVLSTPGSNLRLCAAMFLFRRGLKRLRLVVTVNAPTLISASNLTLPLVFCPTHQSLLDFAIMGSACFRLQPFLPALQVTHVAADAEFGTSALEAIFVLRGGGVSRVFQKGGSIGVFQGLRALREATKKPVALVPVALSYELLPEDTASFLKFSGNPQSPLRIVALVQWAFRGRRGKLRRFGQAHVRLGKAQVLDTSSDLSSLVSDAQRQLVALTVITELHARALAELVGVSCEEVLDALRMENVPVRASNISTAPLSDVERWPLAMLAMVLLRSRLPSQWADWLVEPIPAASRFNSIPDDLAVLRSAPTACIPTVPVAPKGQEELTTPKAGVEGPATMDLLAEAMASMLVAAENTAEGVARTMRDDGIMELTEAHLKQQLLEPLSGKDGLPVPLALGAAHIVSERLDFGKGGSAFKEQAQIGPLCGFYNEFLLGFEHKVSRGLAKFSKQSATHPLKTMSAFMCLLVLFSLGFLGTSS